jgi:hypothetical protein
MHHLRARKLSLEQRQHTREHQCPGHAPGVAELTVERQCLVVVDGGGGQVALGPQGLGELGQGCGCAPRITDLAEADQARPV